MSRPKAAPRTDLLRAEARRVSALRLQMLDFHPFWGFLLAHLQVVPSPGLGAFAATDCWRHIWYDPLRTRHLALPQLGFVLAHELGHHFLASADRRRGRNPHRWNCATDYAINRVVAAIRHPTRGTPLYQSPDGAYPGLGEVQILQDPRWDGMIAEAIYEYLTDEALPAPTSIAVVLSEDGSGDGSARRLPNVTDHGGGVDVHLPEHLSPEQRREIRERLAAAVEHAGQSRQPGYLPAQVLRELGTRTRPRVPWPRLVRRYAGTALGRDDYALHRPDRRFVEQDFVVPGRWSEGLGQLVVALDTSASITCDMLQAVGAELRSLADQVAETTLIVADAQVQEVVSDLGLDRFLAQGRVKGGGGTDHRPVFAWLHEHRLQPDLLVGITDLWSHFPERPPGYPVLWIVPEAHGEAPWGRVVELDTGALKQP